MMRFCSRPVTPKSPDWQMVDLPTIGAMRTFSDIHTGQPETISRRMTPNDQMSKDHGAARWFRF
jgi:hypothetical protein